MQNDGSTTPLRVSVGADSDTRAFASLSPDSPKTQIRIFNLNGNKSTKPVPMYMFPRWVCFGEIVWCANSHSQSVSLIRHSFVSLMLIALCWMCLNLYIHNRRFFGGVCLQTNRPINSITNSYLFNSVLMESNRWIFATCVWFVWQYWHWQNVIISDMAETSSWIQLWLFETNKISHYHRKSELKSSIFRI